jgi:uncharacterized linocin/CFP29 family protein
MNTFRNVGRDEPLTTEQGLYIKDRVVFAARREFKGRKLFGTAIRKIDASTQTFGYDTLTEAAEAALDFKWPGRQSQDIVNLARSTVAIPVLHKEFEINKLDLTSSRTSGTPLNTTTAESATYKVGLLEDALLILGYSADGTNYDINGLYNAAGNSEATSLDWGTVANIVTSINNTIALLLADNISPPYNLVVNPTQYAQTLPIIANTAVSYRQWIEQSLMGGEYMWSPTITAGTGMMTKANPEGMFELVLAEDLSVETETTSVKEGGNLFGRVYIRGLPVVYDSNAIAQMTTI